MNYNLTTIVGVQFGDEGKGKITQGFAPNFDIVARFGGGPNAGHTTYHKKGPGNNVKVVTHVVPTGILTPSVKVNFIGPGCVIDPVLLKKEIMDLMQLGLPYQSIYLSELASLITPFDRKIDALINGKIGTTGKGIGPTYAHKAHRVGMRVCDFINYVNSPKTRKSAIWDLYFQQCKIYEDIYIAKEEKRVRVSIESFEQWFESLAWLIKNINIAKKNFFLQDGEVHSIFPKKEKVRVLAEGAQGIMLDNTFGTYPFVTSSNCMPSAAISGIGLPGKNTIQDDVIGIFKAYCTRVGNGPFDTEIHDDTASRIREKGGEVGSTTGRSRRIGWLDLPDLRYAVELSGVTRLYMTKVDVLSPDVVPEVHVCTDKDPNGKPTDWRTFKPFDMTGIENGFISVDELSKFTKFISGELGQEITMVSYGPLAEEVASAMVL